MSVQPIQADVSVTQTSFGDAPLAQRASLSRKRRAQLAPIDVTSTSSLNSRVPSTYSLSEVSTDSSSDDDSQSAQTDSSKRSRHDSAISFGSDDIDTSSQSSLSSTSSQSLCGCPPSACSHIARKPPILVNESIVGSFRIVGTGRDGKGVHLHTNEVFDAKILTPNQAEMVEKLVNRLDGAREFYRKADIQEMREAVFPAKAEVVEEEETGRFVMFTPPYQRTLHDFANDRSVHITEADIQPIFEECLRIMAFCHTLGIIIRDIKPVKWAIDRNNKIRLANIVECYVCDNPEVDTIFEKFGSPAYVPPEVLSSRSTASSAAYAGTSGKAADIWGMGVMLYLLMFGRYPFIDQTPVKVFQKIKQARVIMPNIAQSSLTRHARLLIFNMLRKSPEERPMAEDLINIPWTQPKCIPTRGFDRGISRTRMTGFEGISNSSSPASTESEHSQPISREPTPSQEQFRALMMSAERMIESIRRLNGNMQ